MLSLDDESSSLKSENGHFDDQKSHEDTRREKCVEENFFLTHRWSKTSHEEEEKHFTRFVVAKFSFSDAKKILAFLPHKNKLIFSRISPTTNY